MADVLELTPVCTVKADTGVYFDLLTDNGFKTFYINLQTLYASGNPYDSNQPSFEEFCALFPAKDAKTRTGKPIKVATLTMVKDYLHHCYDRYNCIVENIFPYALFEIAKQEYPKPLIQIDTPPSIFDTGNAEHELKIDIYRHESHNLISLGLVCNILFDTIQPPSNFLEIALCYEIYFDNYYYYCDLHDARQILRRLEKAGAALLERFDNQIFMSPTPFVQKELPLGCRELTTVPCLNDELTIYGGIGFAENSFFVAFDDLRDLLKDYSNAILAAFDNFGEFIDTKGSGSYCRLDMVGKIVRFAAALKWSGNNEANANIRRAWKFIRWFNSFMPIFLKENVEYTCDLYPFFDGTEHEEPTENATRSLNDLTTKDLADELAGRVKIAPDRFKAAILDGMESIYCEELDALEEGLYGRRQETDSGV